MSLCLDLALLVHGTRYLSVYKVFDDYGLDLYYLLFRCDMALETLHSYSIEKYILQPDPNHYYYQRLKWSKTS